MLLYALRRLAIGAILVLLVTFITYFLLSFSFDNIITSRLGQSASPELVAELKADLGLDRSVFVQYLDWLGNVVQGDLGTSFFTGEPVVDAVPARLAVTLSVIVPALIISVIVAVVLGVTAASRGGVVDTLTQGLMLAGYLIPGLLVAIGLVVLFAVNLGWLPAGGYTAPGDDLGAWSRSIVIPVITIAIGGSANIASQVRGTMVDELRKDYVRTLRTRGVPTRSLVIKHALRNAAGPALTVFGLEFVAMFGSALIIEQVFALPGFGLYSFNAALQGDFPVMMGVTLFAVGLTVTVNLITDLANGWLNPKARIY
ncbi:ABC transporter permease [Demequina zhanjiangensis]|uniref:ABC transporter permease n=1 Tax=Demequina zhanjiangensis TaxID=3051659 RepID=A0ABT8G4X3_9MICO|nr:ABC transporter permease [Demequina sp. SYSU T00b26]MDN4474190.1 ABC transporter permease [Demequina sp. SYSU T00b26]